MYVNSIHPSSISSHKFYKLVKKINFTKIPYIDNSIIQKILVTTLITIIEDNLFIFTCYPKCFWERNQSKYKSMIKLINYKILSSRLYSKKWESNIYENLYQINPYEYLWNETMRPNIHFVVPNLEVNMNYGKIFTK